MLNGNVNQTIEKKGDRIYRNSYWKPYIHDFSQYLEFKKCNRVPRFLGDDENNREILSFLHEYVSGNNFLNCHAIVWTDYIVTMMLVIRLIRMEQ